VSLTNDPTTTTDTVIRFTWADGASDGGSPVIDYTVYYDQGTDSFVELISGVTTQYYLAQSLTPGTTYKFKVTARNSVGSSLESEEVVILAAKIPDAPLNLQDVPAITSASQIGLEWTEGVYNGGSAVIDYELSYTE
jgi:hypothetical protein